jgi:hypothetical protein
VSRRAASTCLLLVLTLLFGACGGAPILEAPASLPSHTPAPVVATSLAPAPTREAAASLPSPTSALVVTTNPAPAPSVEASADPSPTSALPYGLSSDQMATLSSLEQVGEYPLYVMRYYDDYDPQVYGHRPASAQALAWACSLFASLGDGENRLYGRNFDWQFSPALFLFTDPPDGYASVSMVDIAYLGFDDQKVRALLLQPLGDLRPLLQAPHWPFDGMNEHGLAVGMAAVPQGHVPIDRDKPTIGSLGIIREILDHACDVDEALALFEAYNIDMEGGPDIHYLVADRSGRSLLVEFFRGQMVVTPNEQPWHLATNFVTASVPAASEAGCWRYDGIEAALSQREGRLGPNGAMELLSQVSQSNTQWSVVYGLSTGAVQVTMGRQYESPHAFHLPLVSEPGAP